MRNLHRSFLSATLALLLATPSFARVVYFGAEDETLGKELQAARVTAKGSDLARFLALDARTTLVPREAAAETHRDWSFVRFDQRVDGIPVHGRQLSVGVGANGQVQMIHGSLLRDLEELPRALDRKALDERSIQASITAALKTMNESGGMSMEIAPATPVLFAPTDAGAAWALLTSAVVTDAKGHLADVRIFILDAQNGTVLDQWSGVQTTGDPFYNGAFFTSMYGPGGNAKIGGHLFGLNYPPLVGLTNNGICALETEYMHVHHVVPPKTVFPSTFIPEIPYRFLCPTNPVGAVFDAASPINDTFFAASAVESLFQTVVGQPPWRPTGMNLRVAMDETPYINFLNFSDNAAWFSPTFLGNPQGDGFVWIGNGGLVFFPLAAMDVIGHEIGHAFTDRHSGLIYNYGHSGAINEAFSDLTGEATEAFQWGVNSWTIAEDITRATPALRYMYNPTLDGVSVLNVWQYPGSLDPHHGSGIFNYAFYQLATMPAWTTLRVFETAALANRLLWTPSETFRSAACAMEVAASMLSYDDDDVHRAFQRVGLYCRNEVMADPGWQPVISN